MRSRLSVNTFLPCGSASALRNDASGPGRLLTAAEIMRNVYSRLLSKMRAAGFPIFNRRNSLSRWEKAFIIIRTMLLSRFF